MLIWRYARRVYFSVIFHKGDLSIGGGEGASWVLFPVYIVNTVCLVVVPEGSGEEGKEGRGKGKKEREKRKGRRGEGKVGRREKRGREGGERER